MLKIDQKYIAQVNASETLEDLFPLLQNAIELEHATIPPYLTAMFSFKPNTGSEIRTIIHSIVIEEMMHMTIAANIMNAIGGSPDISSPGFIPNYPGPLPMGIGSQDGLIVGLEKFSLELVKNVFMEIEEPENPIPPSAKLAAALPTFKTIGQFYMAVQKKIIELAPDKLPGDPAKQVTSDFFSANLLFPILTKQNAVDAINIIIEQGEGTPESPLDPEKELAHYYKFAEIAEQKRIVVRPDGSYSFSGDPIPFNPGDVLPLFPNTKAAMLLPETSEERRRVDDFNNAYSSLLSGLHRTFNGDPGYLPNTLGVMFDLKLLSEKLYATPFPGVDGYTIGAPYEWVPQP